MVQRRLKLMVLAAASAGFATTSSAAIRISEFSVNPPGADNGWEWFELLSTGGGIEGLDGLSLINVEGDFGGNAGAVDKVISLNGFSTGSNGLFLWRDAATELVPARDPATTLHVQDFNPDWENPSGTFLLVSGFTGAQGDDLDTDDNGVLDVLPWTAVLDGFGFTDGGSTDLVYASQFGFADFAGAAAGAAGALEAYILTPDGVQRGVGISGSNPGPYTVDDVDAELVAVGYQLTPGSANPVVPEPAALGLLALSSMLMVRRRR